MQVSKTLQTTTNPRVFAAGDVVALPEQHTIIKANAHAAVIARNILTLIGAGNKKSGGELTEYTKAMDSILVTNGRVS